MVMKSLAAVVHEQGAPVVVQPVEVASPAPGEALVRIAATGVCHSDHNVYSGYRHTDGLPTILGHEGAGVIEQVGDGVTGFAPGDHVVFAIRPSVAGAGTVQPVAGTCASRFPRCQSATTTGSTARWCTVVSLPTRSTRWLTR